MQDYQAKRLKVGDHVIWSKKSVYDERLVNVDLDGQEGTVVRKRYNTVWIKWDDGVERTHRAMFMDYIFTQEQLDQIAKEQQLAERVKQDKAAGKLPEGWLRE